MEPIRLQLIIPFHQPLSATTEQLAEACERFYEPFIARIEAHPELALTLHFGGHLLDHLSKHREDLLMRIRGLQQRGTLEVLGGLFYGGVPAVLPEEDVRGQLQMGAEYWESLLGETPSGVWLPELAWSADIPRLLSETDVLYGFGSASQFIRRDFPDRGLGVFERNGHRVAVYLLDDSLSRSLIGADVDRWVDSVVFRAAGEPEPVISVWVQGERLGNELGSRAWAFERGWLDSLFGLLAGGRSEIRTVTPASSFDAVRPVTPLKFVHGCSEVLGADTGDAFAADWPDFPRNFTEVDTLHRRMLRTSDKLREAVITMQDEGVEEEWGGALATAQRLVFSAQAPDAYWRGRGAGFSDPEIRRRTYERLIQAESMIDTLVQGTDDFIGSEEDDRDGDLLDEVFVSNRYLTAWLNPSEGGQLRALDDRLRRTTLLDVPPRRHESFYTHAAESLFRNPHDIEARGPRGLLDPLPRTERTLPLEVDGSRRCGTSDWLLDVGTSAGELFTGSALDLKPRFCDWQVLRNEIDEEGDLTFHLELEAELELAGVSKRQVTLRKHIQVPVDRPEMRIDYSVAGADRLVLAPEFPIAAPGATLWSDETHPDPNQTELPLRDRIEVRTETTAAVHLEFSRPVDVWVDRIRTTVRDVDGYRGADQGLVVVPAIPVEGRAEFSVVIRFGSDSDQPDASEELVSNEQSSVVHASVEQSSVEHSAAESSASDED